MYYLRDFDICSYDIVPQFENTLILPSNLYKVYIPWEDARVYILVDSLNLNQVPAVAVI